MFILWVIVSMTLWDMMPCWASSSNLVNSDGFSLLSCMEDCASAVACCRRGYMDEKDLDGCIIHLCDDSSCAWNGDLMIHLVEGDAAA